MVTKQQASINLRKLLCKLGIRSAHVTHLEEITARMVEAYGRPNEIFMSGSVLETFLETFYGEKRDVKQEGGGDAADPVDSLRDWFSVAPVVRNPKDSE